MWLYIPLKHIVMNTKRVPCNNDHRLYVIVHTFETYHDEHQRPQVICDCTYLWNISWWTPTTTDYMWLYIPLKHIMMNTKRPQVICVCTYLWNISWWTPRELHVTTTTGYMWLYIPLKHIVILRAPPKEGVRVSVHLPENSWWNCHYTPEMGVID